MIRITISRNQTGQIVGAKVIGHAGYADAGEDIVCAAVSILIQNAVNSIEALCGVSLHTVSEDGRVEFQSADCADRKDIQLLLESMTFGMRGISEEYPNFVRVREQKI
ncbi:ribosomal-processing cysteine protease Prp [Fodinisporobacter ferrooxydans]|uniref:Ribosomal processing cysteine protease Prp n=1 Tax=Fodinisporobacter ferrooxydans TaxID=2901836 RepID=A0ABY4CI02_9BACL|nr:ribosomal-processing cysteine protease Prp [Alicyclobacillaceae bacterium MYW30-H2]